MVDKIINGISRKLNSIFGDDYRIYAEEIPQDLAPPAFFIQLLQADVEQVVGTRYRRNHSFDVLFFPVDDGTGLQQCREVAGQLLDGLEYITAQGQAFRGTGLRSEIIDGVLHVFVQYNLYVCKETEPEEFMGELSQQGNLKR
jgi:hypothetical protein